MTVIAIALVNLATLAAAVSVIVLLLRFQERTTQALAGTLERERELWMGERRELLNRIKPETAQWAPPKVEQVDPPAPRWDDDGQNWEASMTVEELAAAVMDQDRKMAEATS